MANLNFPIAGTDQYKSSDHTAAGCGRELRAHCSHWMNAYESAVGQLRSFVNGRSRAVILVLFRILVATRVSQIDFKYACVKPPKTVGAPFRNTSQGKD
jgi:hypothetical protein